MNEIERGKKGVATWRELLTCPNISGRAWTVEIQDVLSYIAALEKVAKAAEEVIGRVGFDRLSGCVADSILRQALSNLPTTTEDNG